MLEIVGDDGRAGTVRAESGWVETLFRARYSEMVGLAVLLLGDRARAEDVVQDVFATLHARDRPLDHPDKAGGYLARAVVNGCNSQHRRRRVEDRQAPVALAVVRSAEEGAVADDDVRAVSAALLRLPDRQRACVVCHHHLGMSQSQVAAVLGISVGSVKTHLRRAHARLATLLEDQR